MVDDTYGFQVEAFPRLQRVVIGNVDGSELPPPMLTFLTDLFSQPNLQEVVLELPCADPIWKFLASQAQVRALTIDVSPLRRIARPQAEVMEGVSNLATMPHLQEVVILDWDLYDVFAGDIGQTLGVEPDEAPTAEVMAKIQATSAQRRAQTQMEWMQKIDAIAPQLKVEVKFVEPPGGTARPNSTE
jgi:hypothetical protein